MALRHTCASLGVHDRSITICLHALYEVIRAEKCTYAVGNMRYLMTKQEGQGKNRQSMLARDFFFVKMATSTMLA